MMRQTGREVTEECGIGSQTNRNIMICARDGLWLRNQNDGTFCSAACPSRVKRAIQFTHRVELVPCTVFLVIVSSACYQVLRRVCNVRSVPCTVYWRDPVIRKPVREQHSSCGGNITAIGCHIDRFTCCNRRSVHRQLQRRSYHR